MFLTKASWKFKLKILHNLSRSLRFFMTSLLQHSYSTHLTDRLWQQEVESWQVTSYKPREMNQRNHEHHTL